MKQYTQEDFIRKAVAAHGDKYNYEKAIYVNCRTKVTIICPEHGEFEQNTRLHMEGNGCPECGKDRTNKRDTQEDFIRKAIGRHGNRYNYDKVVYSNSKTKVTIICPEPGHGEFKQLPKNHIIGKGCHTCGGDPVKTTADFIRKSEERHAGKGYGYENVEYVNSNTEVIIICPEHGEFLQKPCNHLQGYGCQTCAGNQRKNTEEFIEQAIAVHGDTYDYEKVDYITCRDKVNIICPVHGEFEQRPDGHLAGRGCSDCEWDKRRKSQEEFIQIASEIHGNFYSYEKVDYQNNRDDITITCPIHDDFEQRPSNHLHGNGCPECGDDRMRKTVEEFKEEAYAIHGDRYGYDKVIYRNRHTKVTITCPKHGDYEQRPGDHIKGYGCPRCAKKGYSDIANEYLDYIDICLELDMIYIGKSNYEYRIQNSYYKADGYSEKYNTIFEFHGCIFHGCSQCYPDREKMIYDKTMEELYTRTEVRREHCLQEGYNYIEIWEHEWRELRNSEEQLFEYIDEICDKLAEFES